MLKINDKYYIDADNYNYILTKKHIITEAEASKRKNAVAGTEEFKNISYHPTIEKRKIFIGTNMSLESYMKDLERFKNELDNTVEKACEEWRKVVKENGNEYGLLRIQE
jgi:hypothetical protein